MKKQKQNRGNQRKYLCSRTQSNTIYFTKDGTGELNRTEKPQPLQIGSSLKLILPIRPNRPGKDMLGMKCEACTSAELAALSTFA